MIRDEQKPALEWWAAVCSVADLVNRDGIGPNDELVIRQELQQKGFSITAIKQALDWLENASLSGDLVDTLGMLQKSPDGVRIDHPLEEIALSPSLLRILARSRERGLMSYDLSERLIEGLRLMDARDWDHDDIDLLFAEVLNVPSLGLNKQTIERILSDRNQRFLN